MSTRIKNVKSIGYSLEPLRSGHYSLLLARCSATWQQDYAQDKVLPRADGPAALTIHRHCICDALNCLYRVLTPRDGNVICNGRYALAPAL